MGLFNVCTTDDPVDLMKNVIYNAELWLEYSDKQERRLDYLISFIESDLKKIKRDLGLL